ncbi:MAG TPA: YihY/virulence factor BrkB family protein, partial [Catalimonadaceae bacterium]|nr:YihY/virulence factor BrkB family protein [Catalimonadaceae bacterium]
NDDNCFRLSAALSYYTLFSIAPLVVVIIATAGYFFGDEAISGVIFNKAYAIIGPQAASGLQTMVKNAYVSRPTSLSGFVSVGVLLFSATVVLTALQSSLNTIWNVRIRADKGIIYFVISRLLALAMMLVIGALLVATIVLNAIWVGVGDYLSQFLAGYAIYLIETGQLILSFLVSTLLFALIYKYLPDAKIRWKNIWVGAFTTSVLFLFGRYGISMYLGNTNITSLYGAAGSVILLIVWVNYSSWIFFLGAEVIHVVALRRGEKIRPSRIAEIYREVVEIDHQPN